MRLRSLFLLLNGVSVTVSDLTDAAVFIDAPSTVEAGTPFNATINVDWHGLADSSYAHAFRIYLGTSYRDRRFYWYHAECFLNYEQSLCDPTIQISEESINLNGTSITVTVPPTVGPSGEHYALIGRILNTDGSYYGSEWQSDVFDLTGANGTWSEFQRQGTQLWGDDGMACTGFACVKQCADTLGYSTGEVEYTNCANACPDVDIDFESSTRAGQPTAALTEPTPCPGRVVTSTDTDATPTATDFRPPSTRTAAAGVGTGAASHSHEHHRAASILLFLAIAVAAW
ncbi:hypothetical protein BDW02DRAFT_598215 [Decorospora gaudefroyi]|uniref:WSC domain-containing protein n=1 Tax=Decorospora gaudefroyi TaxID=184978 RepID=A0A6A5KAV2_9PLEO|nr:hypothetical protein BDW02DRAFT_598215 [Decorospora gaudefroyi]